MKKNLIAAACLLPLLAGAQSTDAEFRALLKERKVAEAETLANERIAKNVKDEVAIWHLANLTSGDAAKREMTIKKAEACVAALPKSGKCHNALGRLYGAMALSSGTMAMMKYAPRIKEEFLAAVEFDPKSFEARRDLNQYYLQAPGIAGGSVRKAIANAEDFGKINAAQGKLLRAEVHIYEKEFDKADAVLAGIQPAGDETIGTSLQQAWISLGFAMINDKQVPKAQSLFERLLAVDMNNAAMHFGLGRAQLENKMIDGAITSMERALKIDPKLSGHYRLGLAYDAKGDKPKALAAFQQFLTYATTGKAADDARQRVDALKKTL
ncbi:MAG: tetratricopeptide repeat protein [Betaproteobacteria bacterium]|nr:tetratricopeptide repeat protein [Betaproteobacteria bacterium]